MELREHIYKILKEYVNENKDLHCPEIKLTEDIIHEVTDFNTSEELLRAGGLTTETLDRAAFGFADEDIKTLMPEQLSIKWKEDYSNVKWEVDKWVKKYGMTMKDWASDIDLSEPIDVSYGKDKNFKKKFFIEDGHHRFYAAKILNKSLNVKLEILINPIEELMPGIGYDNFHRCLFNQVKKWNGWKRDIKIKISDILPINKDGQTIQDAITNVRDNLKSYSTNNIVLLRVGNKYEVLDGFHRIAEKILNGEKYIIADVKISKSQINEVKEIRVLKVYHGTKSKFVKSIKENGLKDKTGYSQGWYMVSTDFASAIFHTHPDDKKDFVYVIEFDVPITENDRWVGYPYLWEGNKINDNSTWFALMKELPSSFIKKIHKVSYKDWVSQKQKGF